MTAPIPLSRVPKPPPFPIDALGPHVAPMVAAVAESTQTDPAMAGVVALGCLAAAAGGRAEVELRPGWREPLNLFVTVVSAPGTRKSNVMREMGNPLVAAERDLVEHSRVEILELSTMKEVADRAAESARRVAAGAKKEDLEAARANAIAAASMAASITVPPVPRLFADDVTPEVLASLLAEQGGRMTVFSAEGGLFENLAGRYSKMPNLDAALKGHAGDTLRVDRRGRAEYVERPALTLVLAIQPSVLESISRVNEFGGRGLLARFLYGLPANNVGSRVVDSTPVPEAVRHAYGRHLHDLALGLAKWTDPAVLLLSAEADALHRAAHRAHEPQLRAGIGALGVSQATIEWGSKLMGAVGRLAGLLHLAVHGSDGALNRPIEADTMHSALMLGDYFLSNALAVFDTMGADPAMDSARAVLRHLHAHQVREFTVRSLFTDLPRSRFPKVAVLHEALVILEEHDWVEQLPQPPQTGAGRPPSPSYRVHDSITGDIRSIRTTLGLHPLCGYRGFCDGWAYLMTALVVVVHDTPAPQGSKRHVGRGIMVESSAKVKPWREAVKTAAREALQALAVDDGSSSTPLTGPIHVTATFTLARPAAHRGTGRNATVVKASAPAWPAKIPDLDKLVRSTLDGVTASGLWVDDAQVVEIVTRKVYPGCDRDALPHPGAVLQIVTLPATVGSTS